MIPDPGFINVLQDVAGGALMTVFGGKNETRAEREREFPKEELLVMRTGFRQKKNPAGSYGGSFGFPLHLASPTAQENPAGLSGGSFGFLLHPGFPHDTRESRRLARRIVRFLTTSCPADRSVFSYNRSHANSALPTRRTQLRMVSPRLLPVANPSKAPSASSRATGSRHFGQTAGAVRHSDSRTHHGPDRLTGVG